MAPIRISYILPLLFVRGSGYTYRWLKYFYVHVFNCVCVVVSITIGGSASLVQIYLFSYKVSSHYFIQQDIAIKPQLYLFRL